MTRMRIGVASSGPRSRPRRGDRLRAVDHDVAEPVDLGDQPGGMTVVESYCSTIAGPIEPVAGAQELALVERRQSGARRAVDVEHDLALERLRLRRVAAAGLGESAGSSSAIRPMPTTRMLMISISASKRWPYSCSCARWNALLELLHPARRCRPPAPRSGPRSPARRTGSRPAAGPGVDRRGRRRRRAGRPPARRARRSARESRSMSRLLSACRSVATNSCWRSVARRPGRRDDARVRRHEHARDLELERDVAREERPAPPAATSVNSRGS